jgi:hypothetical protein
MQEVVHRVVASVVHCGCQFPAVADLALDYSSVGAVHVLDCDSLEVLPVVGD